MKKCSVQVGCGPVSRFVFCAVAIRARVQDHKPSREDETERIKRAGGMVIHKRVMGELAVSRAFGDRAFKIGIKVWEPESPTRRNAWRRVDDRFPCFTSCCWNL